MPWDMMGPFGLIQLVEPRKCMKPCKSWDKLPINWCRIPAINSRKRFIQHHGTYFHFFGSFLICLICCSDVCLVQKHHKHTHTWHAGERFFHESVCCCTEILCLHSRWYEYFYLQPRSREQTSERSCWQQFCAEIIQPISINESL